MSKMLKNIAVVLCAAFACVLSASSEVRAQPYLPKDSMTTIQEMAPWTEAGKKKAAEEAAKKKAEEEAKKKAEGAAPESIAKPKTSQEVIDEATPWSGYASKSSKCEGAYQPQNQDSGTTPDASGMFDVEILVNMQEFMREVYKQLSKVMMIGHSLLCYSQKVAYTCLGWEDIGWCLAKLANMNMFVSGLVIYIVGVLMTMSIGMYFVDISFKLGFAMLFMPVSIALWPFPPTKNKFSENLSIIIRNGMLFTLVAIGVAFAVTLIKNSLFETAADSGLGMSGEEAFWYNIANKRTELLIDQFAFDRNHFLVAAFGLIFGFKILASSVNDYLDYFFSDSVFGSESPMHHMGTQAVGLVAANTIKPAASFVGDVAKTQTGRAIAGVGTGVAMMSTKEGRAKMASNIKSGVQKAKHVVTNPRQTYNAAMAKVGQKANQAVQFAGTTVKETLGAVSLFAPIKESTRVKAEKWMGEKIDKGAKKLGGLTEEAIAHGGGKLQNVAADTVAAGINKYNKVTGNDRPGNFVTGDDVKKAVRGSIDSAKDDMKAVGRGLKTGTKAAGKVAAATAYNGAKMMAGDASEFKNGAEALEEIKLGVDEAVDKFSQSDVGKETIEAWKSADKAPITLQPSAIASTTLKLAKGTVKAPFKLAGGTIKGAYNMVVHPQKTVRQVAQATEDAYFSVKSTSAEASEGAKQLKNMLSSKEGRKVILQKSGRVVLRTVARTVKGTGTDVKHAAEGTASVLGNMLKDFGKSLQDNAPKDGNAKRHTTWQDLEDAKRRKKEAAQEDRDYFKSIDTYDE